MKINNIFESIQGEGAYTNYPVLFIRLSGCTRSCKWCDSKYHIEGENMTVETVIKKIIDSKSNIIVWTGGEPVLQMDEILEVIKGIEKQNIIKQHHLETNGDILPPYDIFQYIAFSPKDEETAKKIIKYVEELPTFRYDIKIVTDLDKVNKDLIGYGTMLMPLTIVEEPGHSDFIRQKVWKYCVKNKIKFCARVQVMVWGVNKRGV